MKHNHSSKNLAEALYLVAEKNEVQENVYLALKNIQRFVDKSAQFRAFLQSKKFGSDKKVEIMNNVMGVNTHPLATELVSYLSGSQATRQLKDICKIFTKKYKAVRSVVLVEATFCESPAKSDIDQLKSSLDKILGTTAELSINIDSSIIGGVKLRIGNIFVDGSIENQLQNLQTNLLRT